MIISKFSILIVHFFNGFYNKILPVIKTVIFRFLTRTNALKYCLMLRVSWGYDWSTFIILAKGIQIWKNLIILIIYFLILFTLVKKLKWLPFYKIDSSKFLVYHLIWTINKNCRLFRSLGRIVCKNIRSQNCFLLLCRLHLLKYNFWKDNYFFEKIILSFFLK